jgi:hypothetical protein
MGQLLCLLFFFSRMTGDVKFAEFEKGSRLHPWLLTPAANRTSASAQVLPLAAAALQARLRTASAEAASWHMA